MADDFQGGTWVTFEKEQPAALCVRRCQLEVIAGPNAGLKRDFGLPVIRIGARGGELVLEDSKVSGVHCEIRLDDTGYTLRDLGSTNGTYVADHRVIEIQIHDGSVIEVGESRIRFRPMADSIERPLWQEDCFGELVGASPIMRELFARLARIAATDATALITGETGTGKDLAAESLHESSPRRTREFVVLDCGSIPPNLIESEIFGHERGAFTGATTSYAGAFERADGGTLFLDEIGELPLSLQPKLLRVLERKQIRRVGGSATIRADVRLVAATNRDLGIEVNAGRFREDLYYRLAVAHIHIPPLRERKQDIPLLVRHFLSRAPGGNKTALRDATFKMLDKHDWPGNVRELRNVIDRAVLLDEQPTSTRSLGRRASTSGGAAPAPDEVRMHVDPGVPFKQAKRALVDRFERCYVEQLLARHGFNVSAAARSAGIDRMTIHKMVERLGIELPGRTR